MVKRNEVLEPRGDNVAPRKSGTVNNSEIVEIKTNDQTKEELQLVSMPSSLLLGDTTDLSDNRHSFLKEQGGS